MPKFGMVIDLQKCVGCSACAIACKAENNTRSRSNQQSYNWADFITKTEGIFPNTRQMVMPVLCNHCDEPACIKNCPTEPTAIFKTPEGFVLINEELCVGCQACQNTCPYSTKTVDDSSLSGETYSVLSFNSKRGKPQPQWADTTEMIRGCTSSGAETAKRAGAAIPNLNHYASENSFSVRGPGTVEKCTFCHHRVSNGLQPACVEVCPSKARIFGDQSDPSSEIAKILAKQKTFRLQEDKGTKPNVHYINKFSPRA